MSLAPALGKDKTIEHLLPVFVKLLKDEVRPVSYRRLNVISPVAAFDTYVHLFLELGGPFERHCQARYRSGSCRRRPSHKCSGP